MFYSCDEGPNENVDHWVNRLRQLLKSWNFEAMIDSLLRDRVVMGMNKGQSWGFTSRSTARVILGQVPRIATCGTRTHRGDSL